MTLANSKPTIPVAEYRQRWRNVQAMMAERELDFLIAYADDRPSSGRPTPAGWPTSRFTSSRFAFYCLAKANR